MLNGAGWKVHNVEDVLASNVGLQLDLGLAIKQ